MLRYNSIKFFRVALLRNFIVSQVDTCNENYISNNVIIVHKRGILKNDYKFYDEHVCGYTNDNLVYFDENEYIEKETDREDLLVFAKKKHISR
jgi:hypothetical protein